MKRQLLVIFAFLLSACFAFPTTEPTQTVVLPYRITPDENAHAPRTDDLGKQIAGVTITAVSLSEKYEFTPPRAMLNILGYMPSVCNELRININPPDVNFRIFIEIYSLVNTNINCDNVFQQFETNILFGYYSSGRYTVWINEALVGDFVSY
ncbi:MAG: hypothetical protein HC797_00105 [Anaerolineales bacterium]|nr:hypothetical protein [Anaerolineales bacterium]